MKKKPTVIAARRAGEDHAVLSLKGGKMAYRRKPCETCPWRLDAVGEFPAEAFRHSASTAYDMSQTEFGCHASGAAKPATCAGYLLRGAKHNMAARIKEIQGVFDWSKITDAGHELFESYRAMAIANGVGANEECLRLCRD